jgi:hypothetical protein
MGVIQVFELRSYLRSSNTMVVGFLAVNSVQRLGTPMFSDDLFVS